MPTYYVFGNFGLPGEVTRDKDGKAIAGPTVTLKVGDTVTTEQLSTGGDHVEASMLEAGLIDMPYVCDRMIYRDKNWKAVEPFTEGGEPNSECVGWLFTAGQVIPMKQAVAMGLVAKAEPSKPEAKKKTESTTVTAEAAPTKAETSVTP